ncbi:pre-mRNA-processing factor 17 [Homalodisca vitripennis]|nr:pre-mRNA-processing factor 17 [Homalodisca vitripennis]
MNREEVVHVSEENITQRKRRIKGEGCWKDDAKKRRSHGRAYTGNKGVNKPAKVPPSAQLEKRPELSVDYKFYLKLFHEHFDLTFGRPQIDSCCKCEELSVKIKSPSLNDATKRVYVAELLVHKRRSKKFFKAIENIRERCLKDNKIARICMDFMQNLQLPEIPVQEIF